MPMYDFARLRAYLKDYLNHFAFETGFGGLHVEAENVERCSDQMLLQIAAQYGVNPDDFLIDLDDRTSKQDDGPESYFEWRRR